MEGIGKRFAWVTALSEVSFSVHAGEVHALLGENGAGKSTLMKLLHGLLSPDDGKILFDGKLVQISSPEQSAKLGIGMVHQHLSLVETLTAAENVLLPRLPFWLSAKKMNAEFGRLRERFGMTVDAQAVVSELPLPEKQQVELLRVLSMEPRLLILDEPTAVLTPDEAARLLAALRGHVRRGGSVIYISHKLEEVLTVADRVTVLRKGRVVVSGVSTQGLDAMQLADWMMGSEEGSQRMSETESQPSHARESVSSDALAIRDLTVRSDRGNPIISGLSLTLRAGEIFGVAGMGGSGQRELCEALIGVRPIDRGVVLVGTQDITRQSTENRRRAGLALIPEDRLHDGVAPQLSVAENTAINVHHRPAGWLSVRAFADFARRVLSQVGTPDSVLPAPVWTLSGGNMQKVILARELSSPGLRVLVAAYPSRGLDRGAVHAAYERLRAFREKGGAVLLFSEELDELCAVADRLAVLSAGSLLGECLAAQADRTSLGLLLGGVQAKPSLSQDHGSHP